MQLEKFGERLQLYERAVKTELADLKLREESRHREARESVQEDDRAGSSKPRSSCAMGQLWQNALGVKSVLFFLYLELLDPLFRLLAFGTSGTALAFVLEDHLTLWSTFHSP